MRFLSFIFILFSFSVLSQRVTLDTIPAGKVMFGVQYGTGWTAGDLVHRYGFMNSIGLNIGYKFKSQWKIGIESNFLFGNTVKLPNLFDALVDSYGNITDVNGDIAVVRVAARGVTVNGILGYFLPLSKRNIHSGLLFEAGLGYINHRVRIETQDQVVPQLELDYKKGYDRLSTGILTQQFVAYSHMSRSGFSNFYGGIYATQGYTYNRRTLFFDQPDVPVPQGQRLDLIFGLRFGWYIPFYSTQTNQYIEY